MKVQVATWYGSRTRLSNSPSVKGISNKNNRGIKSFYNHFSYWIELFITWKELGQFRKINSLVKHQLEYTW